jgi:hypothetical protein
LSKEIEGLGFYLYVGGVWGLSEFKMVKFIYNETSIDISTVYP